MNPIGYVVNFCKAGGTPEPMALSEPLDGSERKLMLRGCYTLFPTVEAAEAELKWLEGKDWVKKATIRIQPVFPPDAAAPFKCDGACCQTEPKHGAAPALQ